MARAWAVTGLRPAGDRLTLVDRPPPALAGDEVRLQVLVCGVCRTDLHVAARDLAPRRPLVVPGHEVVGRVTEVGSDVAGVVVGDRLGAAWLRSTCAPGSRSTPSTTHRGSCPTSSEGW